MKKFAFMLFLLSFLSVHIFAQEKNVTGTVLEEKGGIGAFNAKILVNGSLKALTDSEGRYVVKVQEKDSLTFELFAKLPQTISVAGKSVIDVVFFPDDEEIKVIIVTGLGIKRDEKKVPYAVTTMDNEEITKNKDRSALNALSGKVAGVNISNASGAAGSSTRVIFRGFSTFNGSNQPLYVINGAPISNSASGSNSLNGGTDFGNSGNDINPEDIESISFLKGSAATTLYGSRAANGVIIITTKKGTGANKKGQVLISSSVKLSTPLRLPQLQNVYGQGIFGNWDQRENTSYGPKMDGDMHYWGHVVDGERLIKPYSPLPNNVADFFEVGQMYQNSASLSGGSDATTYYLSFSNVSDDGIMPEDRDSYKRNTVSVSGTSKITEKINSSASINYINKTNKFVPTGQGGQSVWNNILQQPRDIPIIELADYNNKFFDKDNYYSPYTTNPYWPLLENGNRNNEDRVYGMADITYTPIPGLNILFRASTDVANRQLKEWRARKVNDEDGYNANVDVQEGQVEEYTTWNSQLNTDLIVTYNKTFGKDFNFSLMGGHNMNQSKYRSQYSGAVGIDIPNFYDLSNTYGTPVVGEYRQMQRLIGVYGNMELGYKSWLTVALTARADWSSTLPEGNRDFFYPGIGLGFVYSDAFPVLKKIMTYGKLRTSWGQTGNDAGAYQVYPIYSQPGRFPMPNNVNAFSVGNRIANPDLQPELTSEFELGTDMRFFKNRIGIDLTYYNKVINELIFDVDQSASTGYTVQTMNLGKIGNKGIELLLTLTPVEKKNFEWNFSVNFSKNRSELIELPPELEKVDIMGLLGGTEHWFRAYPGGPIGIFEVSAPKIYIDAEGVEHTVVNAQGVPDLSSEGYVDYGKSEYDFMTGFITEFTFYKFISISANVDYRQGGLMHSRTAGMGYFTGTTPISLYNDRQPFIVPNSVMQIGEDDNGEPIYVENTRPILNDNLGGAADSYWDRGGLLVGGHEMVEKTFVKLRSVNVRFSMPKKWITKMPIEGASFSVIGSNLLMWTVDDNNFIDPELTTYGNDLTADFGEFGAMPSIRSLGFNLTVKF